MSNLRTLWQAPFQQNLNHGTGPVSASVLWRVSGFVLAFWIAAVAPAAGQGFTVLHSFAGYQTESGAEPFSALIQGTDGNFYGTTASGGGGSCTFGCGIVYQITAAGTFTVLYSFQAPDWGPSSSLMQATNGNFYGTTAWGGGSTNCYDTNGCGTIYEITPEDSYSILYSFNEAAGPMSGVIQGSDGNFYGTTLYGGSSTNCSLGCGSVFELTPSGTLTTLYSFSGSDGSEPNALILATDGNFYGTTLAGGTYGKGAIFQLTPGGVLTTLHSFSGTDGEEPLALIQIKSGDLWGATAGGGANGGGTVFDSTLSGSLTTIYNFCAQKGCSDGTGASGLLQASDGNIYGTTTWGGNAKMGGGTIFEISGGTLTTIHKFSTTAGNYTNGQGPESGVMQAANGNFYGTTVSGGAYNNCGNSCGTVFTFGPATVTLSKTSLSFGNQALNEISTALSITLTNSGMTVLNISNVTVGPEFAIATNACTGAALTSGQNCRVTVTFTPTALGLVNGTLSFIDNTGNSPQQVPMTGTGVEPTSLTPTSATYAKQVVGTTSAAKTFTLLNRQNILLTNIMISTTGDFGVSSTTCATTLAAKQECRVSVTFTPTETGTRTGTLTLSDSASNSPQVATLTGTGTSD